MIESLVVTKYRLPPLRPNQVSRGRLMERLLAGLERKLTLLTAPAGFGKSTLAVALAHRSGRPTAWLSLDPSENDPARWHAYLAAALGQVGIDLPPDAEPFTAALVNSVALSGRPLLLVLDDLQFITAPAILTELDQLVDRLPPNLHLVITSRSRPALSLARLKVRGELTEVSTADLRFTASEVATLLQRMGLHLPAQSVATLVAKTEGWAAGLQLAALSLQGAPDAPEAIDAFNGQNPDLLDYLVDEVLQNQPPELQSFLLKTSILERLSGPLCEVVTGEADGQAKLQQIEGANLFLFPLDPERRWFRYHALFADFLRARLQAQLGAPAVAELRHRAALWYRSQGQTPEGLEHLLAAGLQAEAADWLEEGIAEWAGRQAPQSLARWVAQLPPALLTDRPRLAIMAAWASIATGAVQAEPQFGAAVANLDLAERALRSYPDPAVQGLLAAVRTALAPWAPLRQLPVCLMEDVTWAARFGQEARRLLPPESRFWRSVVSNSLGAVYLRVGDLAGAAQAFGEAARLAVDGGHLSAAVTALRQQGDLLAMLGQLHAAAAVYQEGLRMAGTEGTAPLHLGLGRLRLQWHDMAGAEESLTEAIRGYEAIGSVPAEALFALASLRAATGNLTEARSLVAEGGALLAAVPKLRGVGMEPWPEGARVLVTLGDLVEARRWVEAAGLRSDQAPELRGAPQYHVLARLLAAEGRGEEALPLLHSLRATTAASKCRGIEAETWLIEALIVGDEGALACLDAALALTAPESFVLLYADRAIRRLLPQVAVLWRQRQSPHLRYLEHLVATLGEERPSLAEPLTEREGEILALVAIGASNQAIAERLFMGVSTVKWHLINIYGKLQVKNRTEAVARARELGLV